MLSTSSQNKSSLPVVSWVQFNDNNLYLVQGTVYFPCDMSVESNFTFDLIFWIHEDSEKNWFPSFSFSKI